MQVKFLADSSGAKQAILILPAESVIGFSKKAPLGAFFIGHLYLSGFLGFSKCSEQVFQ